MKFSFNLEAVSGRLSGIAEQQSFLAWSRGTFNPPADAKPCKSQFLPMMTARRMCLGSRFAADLALELCRKHEIGAAVFSSRHGELERNFSIQSAIAADSDVSPTDFAMSVHNAAAGSFSIVGKQKIPITSISAGRATFPQALCAAVSLLGTQQAVLLVDFDSYIPEFFKQGMHEQMPDLPYAVGFVLSAGSTFNCQTSPVLSADFKAEQPCSLQFCQALYHQNTFSFNDGDLCWQFNYPQLEPEA